MMRPVEEIAKKIEHVRCWADYFRLPNEVKVLVGRMKKKENAADKVV